LVGPSLHHRPDLLHVGCDAGADGRSRAVEHLGKDEAAMMRCCTTLALLLLAISLPACAIAAGREDLAPRVDAALEKAARFLISKQSADGAWRSETYGMMRDGPSLTPLVMSALVFLPQGGDAGQAALRKGASYLAGFVDDKGQLKVGPRELLFPVYTAASASRVVVLVDRTPRNLRVQSAWLAYLREQQLNEALGWQPPDAEYGGWGYALDLPRKPAAGKPKEFLHESNLSATVFALAALRVAQTPDNDPAYAQALAFVKRCQNFSDEKSAADAKFDDGGFFFMPGDDAQNKAGLAGTDRFGRARPRSYGTMTADGVRALLRCGLANDHPRVVAARQWLERNFSAAHNPGEFSADRAVLQDATYYYWVWAVSHTFLALGMDKVRTPKSSVDWPAALAAELLARQRADGSWTNRFTDSKEDDPLIATPWAAAALAIGQTLNKKCAPVTIGKPIAEPAKPKIPLVLPSLDRKT
jgi:squalene-hopene/tetraprenyl-beta-curcumene cyclase